MSIFKILFELFVLYLLYKLIFDFIIPIYQATKQVKQKVNQMHHNVNEQMNQQQQSQYTATTQKPLPKKKNDDYIEFEEVK
jgi:23S rRNA maturation mini-RNase III